MTLGSIVAHFSRFGPLKATSFLKLVASFRQPLFRKGPAEVDVSVLCLRLLEFDSFRDVF
jgi:hypothetical protein